MDKKIVSKSDFKKLKNVISRDNDDTVADIFSDIKYRILENITNRYNKDIMMILSPIIMVIMLVGSISGLYYLYETQHQDYQNKAENYQKDIIFNESQVLKLTDSELKDNKVYLRYKYQVVASENLLNQKKIYAIVTDNVNSKELWQGELNATSNQIELNIKDIKPRYDKLQEDEKGKVDYELYINYYAVDDLTELSYTNSQSYSMITYDDLYVYDDLSDYFEENKSIEEKERELNYIRRKYLTNDRISDIFDNGSKDIIKVFKKPIEQGHTELGELYKVYTDQYNNYISILKSKGITEEEIKTAINPEQEISTIKTNLKTLNHKSEERITQINSGYMKDLNATYKYTSEQIKTLTEGKTSIEIKKILEEEIQKAKENLVKKNEEESKKLKENINKKVSELKKKKVSSKEINKILDNKKLSDKQKLEQLNKLK